MKRLVITEKPSVARDMVAVLGGFEEKDGYWESDAFIVTFAVGHLYELLSPEDLDPKYRAWTLDTLPIIPEVFSLKPKAEHTDRLRTIKKLLKDPSVKAVVNACDAGREGELIFREIVEHNECKLPIERLWLQSMTPAAIRDGFAHLKRGEDFRGLRDAAYCRTYSDWLIGMNATRALTRRLKTRSENQAWSAGRVQTPTLAMLVDRELSVLSHVPVPYFRVVGTFLHGENTYQGTWFDVRGPKDADDESEDRPDRIFDRARAEAIIAKITGKPALANETRKPSRETAPVLFDLTSLQREANRRFGWSARRTLNAAQRCYEGHKVLTYPRTDARALPSDYRAVVDEVIRGLGADPRYKGASRYLMDRGLLNTERTFDDSKISDHFAIIPTGVLPTGSLDGDDARIFDLVVRRFLGTFHPPALWVKVDRTTTVDGEMFRSRARILEEPGWRTILGETAEAEGESSLPPLVPGQDQAENVPVTGQSFSLDEDETKAPPRITEGRLLSLMENAGDQVDDEDAALAMKEKGIGTPATRADIIENLLTKGYIIRSLKALRPSVKGIRLIDILHRMHEDRLASPRLTGEIEQHLSEVEKKRRKSEVFMDEIRDYAREIVDRTKTFEFEELYPNAEPLGACPLCQRTVFERSWFYRCEERPEVIAAWKDARAKKKAKGKKKEAAAADAATNEAPPPVDCPFRIWKDKSGRYIDRRSVEELLTNAKTRVLDGFVTRQGRPFSGELVIEDGQVVLHGVARAGGDKDTVGDVPEYEVNDTPLGACPVCTTGEVVETRSTFVCSKTRDLLKHLGRDEASLFALKKRDIPEGAAVCSFLLPRTVCRREITREEAEAYLRDKRTAVLTDFISRKGRPFSATLVLSMERGRHTFEFPPRAKKEPTAKDAPSADKESPVLDRGHPRRPAKKDAAKGKKKLKPSIPAAAKKAHSKSPAKRPAKKKGKETTSRAASAAKGSRSTRTPRAKKSPSAASGS